MILINSKELCVQNHDYTCTYPDRFGRFSDFGGFCWI